MKKEPIDWITINGNHVPIFEGESKEQAAQRFVQEKKSVKVGDQDVKVHKEKEQKQDTDSKSKTEDIKNVTTEDDTDDEQAKRASKLVSEVTDNTDFKQFIKDNISNLDFKQFGRDYRTEAVKELWYQKRASEELKDLHEMSKEDAISQIRDTIPAQTSHMWFVEADSDIKPKLIDYVMANKGTLNAGLNIAYYNYKESQESKNGEVLSFKEWVTTPQEFYRGDRGQKQVDADIFASYSLDKKVAARFTKSDSGSATVKDDLSDVDMSKITTIKLRPMDTWGSYQTTAEQEFLIPASKLKKKGK